MRALGLILVLFLLCSGCAKVNHSESLTVDHFGATGTYQDSRTGSLYKAALAGGGAGAGVDVAAGAVGFFVDSSQGQSDPRNFAKAIVMVDLDKKLKSIKVDEVEGIREYEYIQPMVKSEYKSTRPQSSLPSCFGRQPIE
jgi:hypothetical protein